LRGLVQQVNQLAGFAFGVARFQAVVYRQSRSVRKLAPLGETLLKSASSAKCVTTCPQGNNCG
jgi:hypothetical protein